MNEEVDLKEVFYKFKEDNYKCHQIMENMVDWRFPIDRKKFWAMAQLFITINIAPTFEEKV